ncbi:MAG: hypothetical protein F6J87_05135 [Spirulina sp. SIO3F2]|nr:hypothetical protein [Spirulina sp. SIO3F2]
MTVNYNDGTLQSFEWDADANRSDLANWYSKFMQSLTEPLLILETSEGLVIIPRQNIKSVEINVLPPKLPPYAIRGVRIIRD